MVSGGFDTNIIAPKALIIPRENGTITGTNNPDGLLFISGGFLHYLSGATILKLSGGD